MNCRGDENEENMTIGGHIFYDELSGAVELAASEAKDSKAKDGRVDFRVQGCGKIMVVARSM